MPDLTEVAGYEVKANARGNVNPGDKAPLESEITRKITRWLNSIPECFWFKIHGQMANFTGSQRPGIPDLYACIRGKSYWIEVKRPGNTLSPVQKSVIKEMREAGATVLVVYSLEELKSQVVIEQRPLFEDEEL